MSYKDVPFETLLGKTLVSVTNTGDEIEFKDSEGNIYTMFHSQDCCESVFIESVTGDLEDLVGSPIILAEEATKDDVEDDYGQWTFYKLATNKGYVDIRWHGSSNGYYSVSVDFVLLPPTVSEL